MPFYGKDWRSPGEEWVKTDKGYWETMKIHRFKLLDHLRVNASKRAIKQSFNNYQLLLDKYDLTNIWQPCLHLNLTTTKECACVTTLGEAFDYLDMKFGVHDVRRLSYIRQVLYILVSKNFPFLSGRTQNLIKELICEIVNEAVSSGTDTKAAKELVHTFALTLSQNTFHHIGSFILWKSHILMANELLHKLDRATPKTPDPEMSSPFEILPNECIINILSNLVNPTDIKAIELSCQNFMRIANDDYLWKQMSLRHFTTTQIKLVLQSTFLSIDDPLWQNVYKLLIRRADESSMYSTTLCLCNLCDAIFWNIYGHTCRRNVTCSQTDDGDKTKVLYPEDFLSLFCM